MRYYNVMEKTMEKIKVNRIFKKQFNLISMESIITGSKHYVPMPNGYSKDVYEMVQSIFLKVYKKLEDIWKTFGYIEKIEEETFGLFSCIDRILFVNLTDNERLKIWVYNGWTGMTKDLIYSIYGDKFLDIEHNAVLYKMYYFDINEEFKKWGIKI